MKYIRTKDKIIDLTSKQVSSYEIIDNKTAVDEYGEDSGFIRVYYYNRDIGEHIEYDNKGGHSMDNWFLKDILKQADTIEELCDMWVITYSKKCHELGSVIANFMPYDKKKVCLEGKVPVYGAIWTDKGLIYVAKMNDKGELELL